MKNKETSLDGFYAKDTIGKESIQETIFDGTGQLLRGNKDNLLYNLDPTLAEEEKIKRLLEKVNGKIADILCWVNFKKPDKKLYHTYSLEIDKNSLTEVKNIGYLDNFLLVDPLNILEGTNKTSIGIGGAVADCAGISSSYNGKYPGEIIGLTHAGWAGIRNGVIEQLLNFYKMSLGIEHIKDINFDLSPMAGLNYEWEREKLEEIFKNILDTYNIKLIEDGIFEEYENNPGKGDFILSRLIKRIFLENGISEKQLNFHKYHTTNLDNSWPSYRIHSLGKNGIINPNYTKKVNNGVIYDSRMGVFNIVYKKHL